MILTSQIFVCADPEVWFLSDVQKYDINIIEMIYDIPGFPGTQKYPQNMH